MKQPELSLMEWEFIAEVLTATEIYLDRQDIKHVALSDLIGNITRALEEEE